MSPIQDIAFVRYQVTDLGLMQAFLADFGLSTAARTPSALYSRAAGTAHHVHIAELGPDNATVGFGLLARSSDALHDVAQRVGQPVLANPEPGGGQRVRFTDPSGFVVDLVHGQAQHAPMPTRAALGFNDSGRRRRLGQTIRLGPQPSTVMRLGHVALLVADFARARRFYQDVLGFVTSDSYWAGTADNTIAAFMHCGLGEQWTDHHTLALVSAQDGRNRFDHSAFEVLDLDDVVQGGQWMHQRGHVHAWGVGRHIQGSQIFDYWRDPFGHKVEHWTDGDLVNHTTAAGHAPISPDELRQWAPPLNPDFFT